VRQSIIIKKYTCRPVFFLQVLFLHCYHTPRL